MKTLTILFLSCLISFVGSGQGQIDNVTIDPINPQVGDTITAYIDLTFTSGPCDMDTSMIQVVDSAVYLNVVHCPGMLTVICHTTDTVSFVLDSAWNYQLTVGLFIGGGTVNCPAIGPPGPIDSDESVIQVSDSSGTVGINEYAAQNFKIYPNPSSGDLQLSAAEYYDFIEIYGLSGRLIERHPFREKLNLSLPSGMYFIRLKGDGRFTGFQSLILTK